MCAHPLNVGVAYDFRNPVDAGRSHQQLYGEILEQVRWLDGLGAEDRDSTIAAAAIAGWQARSSIGVQQALQGSWPDFTAARVPWARQGQPS